MLHLLQSRTPLHTEPWKQVKVKATHKINVQTTGALSTPVTTTFADPEVLHQITALLQDLSSLAGSWRCILLNLKSCKNGSGAQHEMLSLANEALVF